MPAGPRAPAEQRLTASAEHKSRRAFATCPPLDRQQLRSCRPLVQRPQCLLALQRLERRGAPAKRKPGEGWKENEVQHLPNNNLKIIVPALMLTGKCR